MRLVTRGDLDGLTCAVIITSCEKIDEILLVHPQDITDKRLAITGQDILANLPYQSGCGKWFDHHLLTESNERPPQDFDGRYGLAPSAARVVYEYYLARHPELQKHELLLAETDRLDSAQLNIDDVLDPKGYILLGYTLDPRTGLGVRVLPKLWRAEDAALAESWGARARSAWRIARAGPSSGGHRGGPLDGNVATDCDVDPMPWGTLIVYTLFRRQRLAASTGSRGARGGGRGPLDLQPHQPHQRRGADVPLRRRRPQGGRDVPAPRREGRRPDRRADRHDEARRLTTPCPPTCWRSSARPDAWPPRLATTAPP
jgi:hypothetical protein